MHTQVWNRLSRRLGPALCKDASRLPSYRFIRTPFAPGQVGRMYASASPLVGVARALNAPQASDPTAPVSPTLFSQEFSLSDRVALVSGANRGIGLDMAMALAEAGARAVYCLDRHDSPGEDWTKVRDFVARMGMGRLEYLAGDVRDQEAMWKVGTTIGDREGRMDVCIAAAGTYAVAPSLTYADHEIQNTLEVNLKGALFTAQAAGQQMARFGNGGSIIFIASICGKVAMEPSLCTVAYHSSKAAVMQMARSMACELGTKGIRVNTISPGWINTKFLDPLKQSPSYEEQSKKANPLGRVATPDELRGVAVFLASDASSFCTGSDISVTGGQDAW